MACDTMTDSPQSREERAIFLNELSRLLGSSLAYDRMLSRLARLTLPLLGDLCAIDVQDADGSLRRAACAHVDSTKEGVAYEARARYGFSATLYYGYAWGKGVIASIYPAGTGAQFGYLETNFRF